MANIVRCDLPDGIHRFKPFKVSDYRDFLLIRNDMIDKDIVEQDKIVNELAGDYFSELPKSWQPYAFLNVFTSSIGKTKIPIVFDCPKCGKTHKRLFNLKQDPLVNPTVKINDELLMKFKFPDNLETNLEQLILNNVQSVVYKGVEYKWHDLDKPTQDSIINSVDFESFEDLVKKLKPVYFSMSVGCCGETRNLVYEDLRSIFSLLINPDEVFSFYEINHILIKSKYSMEDIMNMIPVERSIALSLIEKDNKK